MRKSGGASRLPSHHSSLITHHPLYLSLTSQAVKFLFELLLVAARFGDELAAALRELKVLEGGDDFGALERVDVSALDVGEAEVVVRVVVAARGRGAELAERGAAV